MITGRVNPAHTLDTQGITGLGSVYYNYLEPALVEEALKRDEGTLGKGGSFLVTTGKHTGRSPKDKFVVRTPLVEDTIWWENNAPMEPAAFDVLHADMVKHMKGRDYFVQDLFGGADPQHRLDVRVVNGWRGLLVALLDVADRRRHRDRDPQRGHLRQPSAVAIGHLPLVDLAIDLEPQGQG